MTMTDTTAVIEVLAVGKGDMKLTFDEGDDKKAKETITQMLRDGYQIFVETDKGLRRVKRFDVKHRAYVVGDSRDNPMTGSKPERQVPFAGSRGRAVAATAGG